MVDAKIVSESQDKEKTAWGRGKDQEKGKRGAWWARDLL